MGARARSARTRDSSRLGAEGQQAATREQPSQIRVFVALWPPPNVRARLDSIAQSLLANVDRAHRVVRANLHLTLAFIGGLDEHRLAEIARRVSNCDVGAFEWVIDRVGFFSRARVAWAGGPDSTKLNELASQVRDALQAAQVGFDRKPFVPHVTLLRDVAMPGKEHMLDEPIRWGCRSPLLVRSEAAAAGVRYVPLVLPDEE